jgi:hypothetical protein
MPSFFVVIPAPIVIDAPPDNQIQSRNSSGGRLSLAIDEETSLWARIEKRLENKHHRERPSAPAIADSTSSANPLYRDRSGKRRRSHSPVVVVERIEPANSPAVPPSSGAGNPAAAAEIRGIQAVTRRRRIRQIDSPLSSPQAAENISPQTRASPQTTRHPAPRTRPRRAADTAAAAAASEVYPPPPAPIYEALFDEGDCGGGGGGAVGDGSRDIGGGGGVPNELMCPITLCVMTDPVLAMDGHTYERAAIERWLRTRRTSPRTGASLPSRQLVPNHAIRALIADLPPALR